MQLKKWDGIPEFMRNGQVKPYYDLLRKKRASLFFKRLFDIIVGLVMLILLIPVFITVYIWIKIDSSGPVFFRQVRITQYGQEFRIFKFRTMVVNAASIGTAVTTAGDSRVTKCGEMLRKTRLDEIPQLLNIIVGDMSFVGTRPEVPKYVHAYSDEMLATLLLPAGVTSMTSIGFKDENTMLDGQTDVDKIYVEKVLVEKMKINLESMKEFSLWNDFKTMLLTVIAVIK